MQATPRDSPASPTGRPHAACTAGRADRFGEQDGHETAFLGHARMVQAADQPPDRGGDAGATLPDGSNSTAHEGRPADTGDV